MIFSPKTGRITIEFQPGADAAEGLEGQVSGRVGNSSEWNLSVTHPCGVAPVSSP